MLAYLVPNNKMLLLTNRVFLILIEHFLEVLLIWSDQLYLFSSFWMEQYE